MKNICLKPLVQKCKGARLKKEVLSVLVDGKNIMDVTDFSVNELVEYIENINLSKKTKVYST